jgi:general secretion pathway protein D
VTVKVFAKVQSFLFRILETNNSAVTAHRMDWIRRIVLKTMPKILAGSIVAAAVLAASPVGAWETGLLRTVIVIQSHGQIRQLLGQAREPEARPGTPQEQAESLLRRARKALNDGNYETAASMVDRAESLKAKWGKMPWNDNPERVRRDIAKARRANGGAVQPRPSETEPVDPWGAESPAEETGRPADREKLQARAFLLNGRKALANGNHAEALSWYRRAADLDVHYSSNEFSPAQLLGDIQKASNAKLPDNPSGRGEDEDLLVFTGEDRDPSQRLATPRRDDSVRPATGQNGLPAGFPVKNSYYDPQGDTTKNIPAQFDDLSDLLSDPTTPLELDGETDGSSTPHGGELEPERGPASSPPTQDHEPEFSSDVPPAAESNAQGAGRAMAESLMRQGELALQQSDLAKAARHFRDAEKYKDFLDPQSAQRLEQHLEMLTPSVPNRRVNAPEGSPIDAAAQTQALARKRLEAEVSQLQSQALRLREAEPFRALEKLEEARAVVEKSEVDASIRDQLLRRVDTSIQNTRRYIEEHRASIELNERNRQILDDVDRRLQVRLDIDRKLAETTQQFNQLMEERRYAEAEVLAKRAMELAPRNPVSEQMFNTVKFIRRYENQLALRNRNEEGFIGAMDAVTAAAYQPDPDDPLQFPDRPTWEDLTKTRKQQEREQGKRRTPGEERIYQNLSTPVHVNFSNVPLASALQQLGKLAGVPIVPDKTAFEEMVVDTNSPVNLTLESDIPLKAALNLILREFQMSYIIRDEVLLITSEDQQRGEVYPVPYNVADLVIAIPNFVPDGRMVLGNAMAQAYADASIAWGGGTPGGNTSPNFPVQLTSAEMNNGNWSVGRGALAQMQGGNYSGGGVTPSTRGAGPGGLGGGAQADFDSLIELIVTTIEPDSWEEVGGAGSIQEFQANLSLVISQTEDVHEQIRDLLEQLRRLQDLQVTIEVRFITLTDDFFERVGIDFDFDIDDGVSQAQIDEATEDGGDGGPSVTVGMQGSPLGNVFTQGTPNFTTDLDLQFRQGSFGATIPQFGGFDPATAATFGFAILSDIEAFFFVQAAAGDSRSNVLQAPKVTLFNGQFASVTDTTTTPFVVSVIPVVGDFAAAHQPVILWLPEGTNLSVNAVVSPDRRFVRMTVIPFFSQIGDVDTFTFEGTTTSTDTSSSTTTDDEDNTTTNDRNNISTFNRGTTVQLPSFSTVSVSTTVSVPDGGTILLGGIKRLREGRNERSVPILSKVPYVNRLFRNVGIGRETQSLMLMVTPRIIIQEEEEENLLETSIE